MQQLALAGELSLDSEPKVGFVIRAPLPPQAGGGPGDRKQGRGLLRWEQRHGNGFCSNETSSELSLQPAA